MSTGRMIIVHRRTPKPAFAQRKDMFLPLHNRPPRQHTHRSSATWPASLLVALSLAGCASLTTPDAPQASAPVPSAWFADAHPAVAGQSPTALAQWWQRFNDPQLSALILQALQSNTDVRSAQAALRQARAQRDASHAVA